MFLSREAAVVSPVRPAAQPMIRHSCGPDTNPFLCEGCIVDFDEKRVSMGAVVVRRSCSQALPGVRCITCSSFIEGDDLSDDDEVMCWDCTLVHRPSLAALVTPTDGHAGDHLVSNI